MKSPSLVLRLDLGSSWPDVVYRHPAKIAERTAPVKAEMNGLSPGLDRRRPSRCMGRQGGQSHVVLVRRQSYYGAVYPLINEMGGKAILGLSRLDCPSAKTGETVNGGAASAVHLDR